MPAMILEGLEDSGDKTVELEDTGGASGASQTSGASGGLGALGGLGSADPSHGEQTRHSEIDNFDLSLLLDLNTLISKLH